MGTVVEIGSVAQDLRGVFERLAVWRTEQAVREAPTADDVALLKGAAQRLFRLADTVDDIPQWQMQQYLATTGGNSPRAIMALAKLAARVGIDYMPDNASAFVFQFVFGPPQPLEACGVRLQQLTARVK